MDENMGETHLRNMKHTRGKRKTEKENGWETPKVTTETKKQQENKKDKKRWGKRKKLWQKEKRVCVFFATRNLYAIVWQKKLWNVCASKARFQDMGKTGKMHKMNNRGRFCGESPFYNSVRSMMCEGVVCTIRVCILGDVKKWLLSLGFCRTYIRTSEAPEKNVRDSTSNELQSIQSPE